VYVCYSGLVTCNTWIYFCNDSLLCTIDCSQPDVPGSGSSRMEGMMRSCEPMINGTVSCPDRNMPSEPCACRWIRRYLERREDVQIQCNQQACNVSCDEGFIGNNATYMCSGPCNCTASVGQEIMCDRGLYLYTKDYV